MFSGGGIYEILNTVNGKRYIGSAVNFKERWAKHRRQLRRSEHHSVLLQRAWDKYTEASFKFLPILTCAKSMLLFYEQQLLDKVKPEYNLALSATAPMLGLKASAATRTKMSNAAMGKPKGKWTTQRRVAASIVRTGKPGHPQPQSARMRLSEAQAGKSPTLDAKKKMSDAAKARGIPFEQRIKMVAGIRRAKAYRRLMEFQGALA